MEPLRPRSALYTNLRLQKRVKIMVGEILPGTVFEYGVVLPGQLELDTGGMGLLLDALGNGLLFGVADFCPAIMIGDAGVL